jgi:hypothetical protein
MRREAGPAALVQTVAGSTGPPAPALALRRGSDCLGPVVRDDIGLTYFNADRLGRSNYGCWTRLPTQP